MLGLVVPAILSAATLASACTIPGGTLSNNISQGFAIQVQNKDHPEIHNRLMNLWEAGGGDKHLYLSPAGDAASDLTLVNGVITRGIIHAVINGEVRERDILDNRDANYECSIHRRITRPRHL